MQVDRKTKYQQMRAILKECQAFQEQGHQIILVECNKKELLRYFFKNSGREWQTAGEDTVDNVYGFLSLANGKAIPYGVYDLAHNRGFFNVRDSNVYPRGR